MARSGNFKNSRENNNAIFFKNKLYFRKLVFQKIRLLIRMVNESSKHQENMN